MCVVTGDRDRRTSSVTQCDNSCKNVVNKSKFVRLATPYDVIPEDEGNLYSDKGKNVCENECGLSVSQSRSIDDVDTGTYSTDKRRIFSFLHWNVNGLAGKLGDQEFIQYVSSFSFICLTETFLDNFTSGVFFDYAVFCKPAVKLTSQGRRSGGVLCLVRKELLPFVKEIKCNYGNCLCFVINRNLLGLDKDVVYMCAYVPPENSSYYNTFDIENGISLLEENLTDIMLSMDDVYLLLCGDFNSRTADKYPKIWEDSHNSYTYRHFDKDEAVNSRCSEDSVLNTYGKLLLNLCVAFGLCIMNGVCYGDPQGRFTYLSDTGNSVNDYFIMSKELYFSAQNNFKFCVADRIESDHMPVEFYINFRNSSTKEVRIDQNKQIQKFEWKDDCAQQYTDAINSDQCRQQIDLAMNLIDVDINGALEVFINCLKEKAEVMTKKIYVNQPRKSHAWFDAECKENRQYVRRLLRQFRKTLNSRDRIAFCQARRRYKNILRNKRKDFNQNLADRLVQSVSDQKMFWQTVHAVPGTRTQTYNSISTEDWFSHFKNVLEKDVMNEVNDVVYDDVVCNDDTDVSIDDYSFNRPISKQEILLAIRRLKNGKAAGPDGVICEMLKHASDQVVNFLVKYFNVLFDSGVYPENWCESIILPLFKKGDCNDPNNYRGISLCDVTGKLYSCVINNRLQEWIDENNITGEHQGGFKKGYSTIDHMFTLLALIQKQFAFNRKLYVAFIDFEKAFDSISRKLLWPILIKNGIKGKLYQCVKSMYSAVKARVRCGVNFTEYINCTQGVKQGDVCSPVLFSLFINELALEIINCGRHGATLSYDFIELFILLFADDIVLLSETIVGLQTQLNNLHRAAMQLQLKVNMSKSNIVVFRKGGHLAAREIWFYGGLEMAVVNSYKYLGIYFSTKLSFSYACQDLVSKAKRALLCMMSKLYRINNNSLSVFFKLFDAQIQPIVQYGAEIWGLESTSLLIEKIHLFAMKRFLGVDMRTPNDLVYGELGRYPVHINSSIRCIRYWFKLISMDESRLPFKAYKMLLKLDERGKVNWVSNIRRVLCTNGFAFVWENQGVGHVGSFLRQFKQRLIDCRWQQWNSHIESSDRFGFYRKFKMTNDVEPYLLLNLDRQVRSVMSRFRLGVSDIAIHSTRYKKYNADDLICPFCKEVPETEVHFVLCCPILGDLRSKFIQPKYCDLPGVFNLVQLLTSSNEHVLKNLAIYLYAAFKKRRTMNDCCGTCDAEIDSC